MRPDRYAKYEIDHACEHNLTEVVPFLAPSRTIQRGGARPRPSSRKLFQSTANTDNDL